MLDLTIPISDGYNIITIDLNNSNYTIICCDDEKGFYLKDMPPITYMLNDIEMVNNNKYANIDKLLNNDFFSYMFLFAEPFNKKLSKHILKNMHFSPYIFLPVCRMFDLKDIRRVFYDGMMDFCCLKITRLWNNEYNELCFDKKTQELLTIIINKMQWLFQMSADEIVTYVLKNNNNIQIDELELKNFVFIFNKYFVANDENKNYIINLFNKCCNNIKKAFPACKSSGIEDYISIMLMIYEEDKLLKQLENDYVLFSFLKNEQRLAFYKEYPQFFSARGYLKLVKMEKSLREKIEVDKKYSYMKMYLEEYSVISPSNIINEIAHNNSLKYFNQFMLQMERINSKEEVDIVKGLLKDFGILRFLKYNKKKSNDGWRKIHISNMLIALLSLFNCAIDEKMENKILDELSDSYYDLKIFTHIGKNYTWKSIKTQKFYKHILMAKKIT